MITREVPELMAAGVKSAKEALLYLAYDLIKLLDDNGPLSIQIPELNGYRCRDYTGKTGTLFDAEDLNAFRIDYAEMDSYYYGRLLPYAITRSAIDYDNIDEYDFLYFLETYKISDPADQQMFRRGVGETLPTWQHFEAIGWLMSSLIVVVLSERTRGLEATGRVLDCYQMIVRNWRFKPMGDE